MEKKLIQLTDISPDPHYNWNADLIKLSYSPRVILPIIRRVLPNVLAQQLIGVQPMSGPVAQVFGLRHTYDLDPLHAIIRSCTLAEHGGVEITTLQGEDV